MLSALLGPLRFEDEEKDAEMGDDDVMEGEKEGENKEGQEGEEATTEKKEESENAEKAPEEGNPENKEENKKPTESVSSETPKAEKYVYYIIQKVVWTNLSKRNGLIFGINTKFELIERRNSRLGVQRMEKREMWIKMKTKTR